MKTTRFIFGVAFLLLLLLDVHGQGNATIFIRSGGSIYSVAPNGSMSTVLTDATDLSLGGVGSIAGIQVNSNGTIYFNGASVNTENFFATNWEDSYQVGGSVQQVASIGRDGMSWTGVAVTPNNTLYVLNLVSFDNPPYDINSAAGSSFGPTIASGNGPFLGLTSDVNGNLYYFNGAINKWSPTGGASVYPGYNGPLLSSQFFGIAADSNGDVFYSINEGSTVGVYEETPGGTITNIDSGVSGSLAVDESNDLYLNTNGTLEMMAPGGGWTTVATGVPNGQIAAAIPEPGAGFLASAASFLFGLGRFRRSRGGLG